MGLGRVVVQVVDVSTKVTGKMFGVDEIVIGVVWPVVMSQGT